MPVCRPASVLSYTRHNGSHIDANISIAGTAVPGIRPTTLRLENPLGREGRATLIVAEVCGVPRPPNPIPALYAVKRSLDVELSWKDSVVDRLHQAAEEYLPFRSVDRPDSGYTALSVVPDTGSTRETTTDSGAILSDPPLSSLHFYKVSARNTAGDSGDLP